MKIAVLLSGGVDSSVALAELVHSGDHQITAHYLKIWLEDELDSLAVCPWEEDLSYARAVTDQLGVQLLVTPLQLEYHERVVSYALHELAEGRTPSPDIFCNQRIKFGAFVDAVMPTLGDGMFVASGHYARVERDGERTRLFRSPDEVKDQTYFLSHLRAEQLARAVFPLGRMRKAEVRAKAQEYELATAKRPDSQGICFLGKIRYRDFVRHYLGEREGPIIERESGAILGKHDGFWFHTIGQRQGLGLAGGPWYVVAKDPESNTLTVSHARSERSTRRDRFEIGECAWINESPTDGEYGVKIRHGPNVADATLTRLEVDRYSVRLAQPDRGVAPGQFAVVYRGSECLGGAKILEDQ